MQSPDALNFREIYRLKRSWAGEVRNVSLLVAIGVNADGYREILGIVEGRTRPAPSGRPSAT